VVGSTDWEDVMDQLKAMSKTCQDVTDEEIEMVKQKARDIYLGTTYLCPLTKSLLKTQAMHI